MAEILDIDEVEKLLRKTEEEANRLDPKTILSPDGNTAKKVVRGIEPTKGRIPGEYISPLVKARDTIYNPPAEYIEPKTHPLAFGSHEGRKTVVRNLDNYKEYWENRH